MILIILGRVGNQRLPKFLNFPYNLEKLSISYSVLQANQNPPQKLFFVLRVQAKLPYCQEKSEEHVTTLVLKQERLALLVDY